MNARFHGFTTLVFKGAMHLYIFRKPALAVLVAFGATLPAYAIDVNETSEPLLIEIGRDLFFDPILSGNKNIACATCHHPDFGSSDGVSLAIGEGGHGLGPDRIELSISLPEQRVPRNAPALFNLGFAEFTTLLHDGRVDVSADAPYGIAMPEGHALERSVPNALAAQVHLPITSATEMAGQPGENEVADAVAENRILGPGGARDILAKRVAEIDEYLDRFEQAGVTEPLNYADIATALAAFIGAEFEATNSPYDRYMNGDVAALTETERRGLEVFNGAGGCASCHSGRFQTDHNFYSIALPQFGPGKGGNRYFWGDDGRAAISGNEEDLFRFRTPSLRNVTLTAPYGHNGAYSQLEDMVKHHLDPLRGLALYDLSMAEMPKLRNAEHDDLALSDFEENLRIAASVDLRARELTAQDFDDLMAFLNALTDQKFVEAASMIPDTVPSGLPID